MAVETLGFRKKIGFREIAVHDSDPIIGIEGAYQVVTCFLNGFHMPGSNVPCGTNQCEILHLSIRFDGQIYHLSPEFLHKTEGIPLSPVKKRSLSPCNRPIHHPQGTLPDHPRQMPAFIL